MDLRRLCGWLLLSFVWSFFDVTLGYGQGSAPPATLRVCTDQDPNRCGIWTFSGGRYHGWTDWEDTASIEVRYFGPREVRLVEDTGRETILYVGTISGESILNGEVRTPNGAFPLKVYWGQTMAKLPPVTKPPQRPVVAAVAPQHHIMMPPGAAPIYATYPEALRAVLQPEYLLLPTEFKWPCDSPKEATDPEADLIKDIRETSPGDSTDIGKYAIKAGEFERGICWLKRGAALGSTRAVVILGALHQDGIGVPKNPKAAFVYYNSIASKWDPWDVWYLAEAYENGNGVERNKQMGDHLNVWLMMHDSGQQVYLAIGADDAEKVREFNRAKLYLDPPMKQKQVCDYNRKNQPPCYTTYEIDQDKMNRQLQGLQ